MKFLKCIRYEFKNMIMQPEFLFALAAACLLSLTSLTWPKHCLMPDFSIASQSPEQGSLLFTNAYGRLLYQFICPILASIPVACSYFKEKSCGMDALLIPACGRKSYILAKAVMTFLSGFFIATLPFLLNMLYAELAFTRNELVSLVWPLLYEGNVQLIASGNFFGQLMLTHPALNHFLHISLIGLWSAGAALLTLGISFFFRKHYLINLLISSIVILFAAAALNAFGLQAYNPQEYFPMTQYMGAHRANKSALDGITELSGQALAIAYSVLYGACAALIGAHLIKHRDII